MNFKKKTAPPLTVKARNNFEIELSAKSLYVDINSIINGEDYKYNNLQDAILNSSDGTPESPMIIYIEPGLYQIDGTNEVSGLIIDKDYLRLSGLSSIPSDIILADNRGNELGCKENSATITITGTGFQAENITIGNYCNLDLEYPLDQTKNQKKRSNAITRANCITAYNKAKELDQFIFGNVHFIGMNSTVALSHVKRIYYRNCYLQGSENIVAGGNIHVYKDCTLHCFSSNPIFHTGELGMAFINCTWDIECLDSTDLNLVKHSSTLYMLDCNFTDICQTVQSISWTQCPADNLKCSYHNIKKDGRPYTILPEINGMELVDGNQLQPINPYNLLCGNDNWNPCNIIFTNTTYAVYPIHMNISNSQELVTGENSITIDASIFPNSSNSNITWELDHTYINLAPIPSSGDISSSSVMISGANHLEEAKRVLVTAVADNKITNQCYITVLPPYQPAPTLTEPPLMLIADGRITLKYQLSSIDYTDESIITWYYLNNSTNGFILAETSVSRSNKPNAVYKLSYGDIGKYIIVTIEPKHNRSRAGEMIQLISPRHIALDDIQGLGVEKYNLLTDFTDFPDTWNQDAINGGWILDGYKPNDQINTLAACTESPWTYGSGVNETRKTKGLLTTGYGARLIYKVSLNVLKLISKNISFNTLLVLKLNPEQMTGDGFDGPNGQYLEIYIKYNPDTRTGYGLRIERTPMYSSATCFTLYKYENGNGKPLGRGTYASAFSPKCIITMYTADNKLKARVTTTSQQSKYQIKAGFPEEVKLSAEIEENNFYSVGIQHTGIISEGNRVQLLELGIKYKR